MSAVLASVRNLDEAQIVAACSVPWIDLKEPDAGALGAVALATITEVAATFGSSHTVSATIGDHWLSPAVIPARARAVTDAGAHYAKVGLYASAVSPEMIEVLRDACAGGVRVIGVCFAEAPPGADDIARLAESGVAGLMLDTAEKAGPSLGGLMSAVALAAFVASVKAHGLLCGLAGKLALADVMPLRALGADYLGFRSALCAAQARTAAVEQTAVRALMQEFNREVAPVTSPLVTAV